VEPDALPGRAELFSSDGFIPARAGYDVWAERMLPQVIALLRETVAASA